MADQTTAPAGAARLTDVAALVAVVVGIIAVAFRGSWGALRDAALAAHFDRTSAVLYPFAVDGLLVVAIIAVVLLRHDRGARWYCLGIIAGYTAASWLINFLHGLGTFTPDPVTGQRPVPPWPVVVVIASLVIGSIFLGSHLLVYVWRHLFPDPAPTAEPIRVDHTGTDPDQNVPDEPELPATNIDAARLAYRQSLRPGMKALSQAVLMNRYGVTKREAARVQDEVKKELAGELDAADGSEGDDEPESYSLNGRVPSPPAGVA